ncbi:hypothetical protein L226DRAFT_525882 [Lentinus tigrinus ALCF2SS1-7]|uniref:DUF6532 domain-containing protein n=1 Tax=Lentinus tigrinus ALCF2SS1-6 TaxID=1328759 RepID=A0A5C2RQI6_9APHY|nr:hypothetical protein L227DRAFT_567631 [Lentinus tigrinus ALCF2SS1-6]RPD70598.1 hypothetical protein L226DRAFT_525882 [Lentinus tigrinus ALCF2SS1-7]
MSQSANSSRPRRAKANLHPGKIVLDQKTPRRSSAEVAQERAALEAEHQQLLKKQEEAMKALADLEARLLEAKERSQQESTRRPTVRQSARKPAALPQALTAAEKVAAKTPASGRVTASADTRSTPTPDAPAKKNVPKPKRIPKLTRADFEAYRDAQKTQMRPTQQENVEPLAGQKRVLEESLTDGSGDRDTGITTPPSKKGKTGTPSATATSTDPLPLRQPGSESYSSLLPTPSLVEPASPTSISLVATDSTASTNTLRTTETDSDPEEAGIIERFGGYGEDETDEQLQADRHDLQRSQDRGKAGRSTAQAYWRFRRDKMRANGPREVHETKGILARRIWLAFSLVRNATSVNKAATTTNNAEDDGTSNQSLKALQPILGDTIGRFTYHFIPKLINTIGNSASGPWRLYGFNLVGAMRDHAAEVWPGIDIDISPRHAFYDLAKQKISDYRAAMGTEAIHAVSKFMSSRRFTGSDDRKEWVQWALDPKTFPFRYERVEKTANGEKKYGIYQNKLILYTLGYHLKRIQLPAQTIRDHPCNALALATTAVERALRTWETGEHKKPRGEAGKFSDKNWGKSANEYLTSINNISDEKWDKILAKAEQYARGLVNDSDDNESEYGDYDAGDIPAGSGRALVEDCDDDDDDDDVEMGPECDEDDENH